MKRLVMTRWIEGLTRKEKLGKTKKVGTSESTTAKIEKRDGSGEGKKREQRKRVKQLWIMVLRNGENIMYWMLW
jgi:hypothetical protein